jgi:hypothetical protein
VAALRRNIAADPQDPAQREIGPRSDGLMNLRVS